MKNTTEAKTQAVFRLFLLVDGGLPSSVQENLEQLKFVFFKNKGYNIITRLGVMAPA